jgi:SulP family sulfate permease
MSFSRSEPLVGSTAPTVHVPEPTVRSALRSPRRLVTEVLAGLVVALALIPEAISFSIIAGVDPRVGLFASFTMAVSIAFLGGRPAMISAATGAIALVIAPVAREYGLDYLIATVILGGIIQVALGVLGVARLMRFIPRSVMVGFVEADVPTRSHVGHQVPVPVGDSSQRSTSTSQLCSSSRGASQPPPRCWTETRSGRCWVRTR